jgi:anti-sigma B factor antagonist
MSSFHITDEAVDRGVHVIPVDGYVDFDAAPQLKRVIVRHIEEGGHQIVVDLSGAGFIDSTGIGVLVGALKRLRDVGGAMAVVCPDEDMRNIFEVVGLEDVIPLHPSRDDAVSAIARAA